MLAPLTLIIWGMIVFRIIGHLRGPAEDAAVDQEPFTADLRHPSGDTLILLVNYADPFLDHRLPSSLGSLPGSNVSGRRSQIQGQPAIVWPEIRYEGIITNKNSKNTLYLIQVENSDHMIRPGDTIGKIKLIRANADSISVQMNNHMKWIKRAQL